MKINLLIVESPLQLLNAYEAIHFFKLKKYDLLVRYSGVEENDLQMAQLLKTLQFNLNWVKYVFIKESRKNILDVIKLAFYRVKYVFKVNKIECLFIGNFNSGFFKLIRSQFVRDQIILLDDGSLTLEIQKTFSDNINYDLFTMYDVEPFKDQTIYHNAYAKTKLKSNHDFEVASDTVLFLGSGLSEIDIITSSEYIRLMTKISLYYETKNKKILYIPHRRENTTKVTAIAQISNIELLHTNYPIELFGIFEQRIPVTVASFYSTALITMRNVYGVEVECFYFDYGESIYKDEIDLVYGYYQNEMNIIELDVSFNV